MMYREHKIQPHKQNGGYVITRQDGAIIGSQPSVEFAESFIDRTIKECRDAHPWPNWREVE